MIVAREAALPVSTVATMISISAPHVSRTAEKLVQRGLLKRSHSPSDRRIALLEPTPEGRALDTRVQQHYHAATAA